MFQYIWPHGVLYLPDGYPMRDGYPDDMEDGGDVNDDEPDDDMPPYQREWEADDYMQLSRPSTSFYLAVAGGAVSPVLRRLRLFYFGHNNPAWRITADGNRAVNSAPAGPQSTDWGRACPGSPLIFLRSNHA